MWEIISFGNVGTLNLVFNAIASIFNGSTFLSIATAVALFSVLGHTVSNLGNGAQELPYAKLLAGLFIFTAGFTTFTSVSIEDRYDGTVTQIDNIPMAVAVPASLISQIGYKLMTSVETAFGEEGMNRISENGYLSPLKVISNVRLASFNKDCLSDDKMTGNGINLCKSLSQYIQDCTSVKTERDNLYTESKEKDLLTFIGFSSSSWGTQYVDEGGTLVDATCEDAYDKINGAFNGGTWDRMITVFDNETGVRTGETTEEKVSNALKAMNIDANKSRNLLQTMFLLKPKETGTSNYLIDSGSSDLAENLSSSIQQRNYAWAMQGEMWVGLVEVFLTIIEALLYAVTPLVALMTLTGAGGAKSMLLYLQMLAVIQLIPSLLVIVQDIIMDKMEDFVAQLAVRGWEVGSEQYMLALTDKTYELMGLGGMLAATVVPALAMSLVTGSGMAMMGAIKGASGATPKDTDAMPQGVNQGAAMKDMSGLTTQQVMEGGDSLSKRDLAQMTNIQSAQQASRSVEAAKTKSISATQAYEEANSNVMSTAKDTGFSESQVNESMQSASQTRGSNATWAKEQIESAGRNKGWSENAKSEVQGLMTLGGSFAIAGGQLSDMNTRGLGKEAKEIWNEMTSGKKGEALSSAYSEQATEAAKSGKSYTTGDKHTDQQAESYKKAYTEQQQAGEQYKSAQTLQRIQSMSQDDKYSQYKALSEKWKTQDAITSQVSAMSYADQEKFARKVRGMTENSNGESADVSENMARLVAFSQVANENGDYMALSEVVAGFDAPKDETGIGQITNEGVEPPSENGSNGGSSAMPNFGKNQHVMKSVGSPIVAPEGAGQLNKNNVAELKESFESDVSANNNPNTTNPYQAAQKETSATKEAISAKDIQNGKGDNAKEVLARSGDDAKNLTLATADAITPTDETISEYKEKSGINDSVNFLDSALNSVGYSLENNIAVLTGDNERLAQMRQEKAEYSEDRDQYIAANGSDKGFPKIADWAEDKDFQVMMNEGYLTKDSQGALSYEYQNNGNGKDLATFIEDDAKTKPSHSQEESQSLSDGSKYENAKLLHKDANGYDSEFVSKDDYLKDKNLQLMMDNGYLTEASQEKLKEDFATAKSNAGDVPLFFDSYVLNEAGFNPSEIAYNTDKDVFDMHNGDNAQFPTRERYEAEPAIHTMMEKGYVTEDSQDKLKEKYQESIKDNGVPISLERYVEQSPNANLMG